ncbi:hypothetical protein M433DRAFT_323138 [Acidomyces richmondensis BFW]|nr:MAG: hypothetical protein FE78DRAFT_492346 [Acidomyces sp. 'richmondensis']KYG49346.1 hypothetical protein M433DRAFT_323138 [Acidomyces richmondensis BFW]
MVYSLTYRRPSKVTSSGESLNGEEKQNSINESVNSGSSCMSNGIPEALSFDRIISNGVCPFRDYCARFDQLPESEKVLSPPWTLDQADADVIAKSTNPTKPNPQVAAILRNTDFGDGATKTHVDSADPFNTPPKSSEDTKRDFNGSEYDSTAADEKTLNSSHAHQVAAEQAFHEAGLKLKPFTIQPYRDEINRIITTYIASGSPRELNLSATDRQAVMHALQGTTHPSAFRSVVTTVEYTLRKQSHPNFIRWSICNGNRPRVLFARGLGVAGIVAGFVADLLITLSHASRPWRVIPFLGWFIGISTLIAAWKGMCVVLHGMHHRHVRPWELFSDEPDDILNEKMISKDSLLSQSTNSFEDEPWIARYRKRNIARKIFDREIWISEPALRQIQDTIFLQAILGAFVLSAIFVAIFCAVPRGNFY